MWMWTPCFFLSLSFQRLLMTLYPDLDCRLYTLLQRPLGPSYPDGRLSNAASVRESACTLFLSGGRYGHGQNGTVFQPKWQKKASIDVCV